VSQVIGRGDGIGGGGDEILVRLTVGVLCPVNLDR
jgi:hypothetical protein